MIAKIFVHDTMTFFNQEIMNVIKEIQFKINKDDFDLLKEKIDSEDFEKISIGNKTFLKKDIVKLEKK